MNENAFIAALPNFLTRICVSEQFCRLVNPDGWCNSSEYKVAIFEMYECVGEHGTNKCDDYLADIQQACGFHFDDIRRAGFLRRVNGIMHVVMPSQLDCCECEFDDMGRQIPSKVAESKKEVA